MDNELEPVMMIVIIGCIGLAVYLASLWPMLGIFVMVFIVSAPTVDWADMKREFLSNFDMFRKTKSTDKPEDDQS